MKQNSFTDNGSVLRRGSADAAVGTIFQVGCSAFKIIRLNARSETSVILKAESSATAGKFLAIKCLDISKVDPQFLRKAKRFLREQKTHARLKHENIVAMVGKGRTSDGFPYMALEYVDGTIPLHHLPGSFSKLPLNYLVKVISSVCDALAYAHEQGIYHNDLSPNDILIGKTGSDQIIVKVTDFGKGSPLIHCDNQDQQLTQKGDLFGHPECMSPEAIRSKPLDARSNIFSLGYIMYLMLCDQNPFQGTNWATILVNRLHAKPPQLSTIEYEPALTAEINLLLSGCMEAQAENRFQNMLELKNALNKLKVAKTEDISHARLRNAVLQKQSSMPR